MNKQIEENQKYVETVVNQFASGLLSAENALRWLQNAEDFVLRNHGGSDYDALCSQVLKAKIMFLEA